MFTKTFAFLQKKKEELQNFITDGDLDDYINYLKRNEVYADHTAIEDLASQLDCRVRIIWSAKQDTTIGTQGVELVIGYLPELASEKHAKRAHVVQGKGHTYSISPLPVPVIRTTRTTMQEGQEEAGEPDGIEDEYKPSARTQNALRRKADTIPCTGVDRKKLLKVTTQVATRYRMSATEHLAMVSATVVAAGGDMSELVASPATIKRHRKSDKKEKAAEIRAKKTKPKYPVLQLGRQDNRLFVCLLEFNVSLSQ